MPETAVGFTGFDKVMVMAKPRVLKKAGFVYGGYLLGHFWTCTKVLGNSTADVKKCLPTPGRERDSEPCAGMVDGC